MPLQNNACNYILCPAGYVKYYEKKLRKVHWMNYQTIKKMICLYSWFKIMVILIVYENLEQLENSMVILNVYAHYI